MSSVRPYLDVMPNIGNDVYIDPNAAVIGDVHLANDVSVWPFVSIRGDVHSITIGEKSNIQDNTVCHVTHKSQQNPNGFPLIIGNEVTVGHQVTLHACEIQDRCLIGMGSIILDGTIVESEVLIGAGTVVPPNSRLKSGYLYLGNPMQQKRQLSSEEIEYLSYSAHHYVKLKNSYLNQRK